MVIVVLSREDFPQNVTLLVAQDIVIVTSGGYTKAGTSYNPTMWLESLILEGLAQLPKIQEASHLQNFNEIVLYNQYLEFENYYEDRRRKLKLDIEIYTFFNISQHILPNFQHFAVILRRTVYFCFFITWRSNFE